MRLGQTVGRMLAAAAATAGIAGAAWAAVPTPWRLDLQEPATQQAAMLVTFHDWLVVIITAITLFVLALLVYVMWRFRASRHPVPSRTTHNTVVEIVWTVVPVLVLVAIAIPSFRILYYLDRTEDAELTLKIIGRQWYWSYEYPDNGNFTFDSNLIPEGDLQPGQLRLLEVDNRVVLPVDTDVRLLFTASDVLHAWTVPAFGVKMDSVPGRTNETWMRINKEGIYYGQCSELCGVGHAYMPVAVEVVSKERFAQWAQEAQQRFAKVEGTPPQQLADASAGQNVTSRKD